MKSNKNKKLL